MASYTHYHNFPKNTTPLERYKAPKPFDPDTGASVYNQDYRKSWGNMAQKRPWYHTPNVWPAVVDTRRTIDPYFEVSKKEKQDLIRMHEGRRLAGVEEAAIVKLRPDRSEKQRCKSAQRAPANRGLDDPEFQIGHKTRQLQAQEKIQENEYRQRRKSANSSVVEPCMRRSKSMNSFQSDFQKPAKTYGEIEIKRKCYGLQRNNSFNEKVFGPTVEEKIKARQEIELAQLEAEEIPRFDHQLIPSAYEKRQIIKAQKEPKKEHEISSQKPKIPVKSTKKCQLRSTRASRPSSAAQTPRSLKPSSRQYPAAQTPRKSSHQQPETPSRAKAQVQGPAFFAQPQTQVNFSASKPLSNGLLNSVPQSASKNKCKDVCSKQPRGTASTESPGDFPRGLTPRQTSLADRLHTHLCTSISQTKFPKFQAESVRLSQALGRSQKGRMLYYKEAPADRFRVDLVLRRRENLSHPGLAQLAGIRSLFKVTRIDMGLGPTESDSILSRATSR